MTAMIPLKEILEERERYPGFAPQCPSIVHTTKGYDVFCLRPAGHAGDHRGLRKQWPQEADKP